MDPAPVEDREGPEEVAEDAGTPTPPDGQWQLPHREPVPDSFPPPTPPAVPARGAWRLPPSGRLFPSASARSSPAPSPWQTAAASSRPAASPFGTAATDTVEVDERATRLAEVPAALALTIDVAVGLLLFGTFLVGLSGRDFLGATLVSQFDHGFRVRLLSVFGQAAIGPAIMLVVAVALAAWVSDGVPRFRRAALAGAAGLGVYVTMGALLRVIVFLSYLSTSGTLAIGSAMVALAAMPVAAGATMWAAMLITAQDRAAKELDQRA